jgi:hypothetical protein
MIEELRDSTLIVYNLLRFVSNKWQESANETNALRGSRTEFPTIFRAIARPRIGAEFGFSLVPGKHRAVGSSYRSGRENGGNHSFV